MNEDWYLNPAKKIEQGDIEIAKKHQSQLTKPIGSLGTLEDIAIQFCGWQQTNTPNCEHIQVCIFAADHGVCTQGVSAFPQEVTAQMVANFINGGAAISVLASQLEANFKVVNIGVASSIEDHHHLVNSPLMAGTNDFTQQAAMTRETLLDALDLGRQQVNPKASIFIGGDMGIGNTTSASGIYSALLKQAPESTAGPGTGVDKDGIAKKRKVLYQAMNLHGEYFDDPMEVLQRIGGLEIAGLVGAYIECAQQGVPILIDGFISTAAALLAVALNSSTRDWMLFAHTSAEPAHQLALESLKAKPLLNLGMRLGEGSGAAIALPLIQNALELHCQMATFSSAGVSES